MRIALSTILLALPMLGQWTGLPKDPTNLTAPAPKPVDGHPDLSGVWQAAGPTWLQHLYPKPEELPFTSAGRALFDARKTGAQDKFESDANCLPQGVPKINATPVPFRVFQMKDRVVILYEAFNLWRQVFLDGRRPVKDANPTWLGYSTGRYDKGDLVVETTNFNGRTWLDMAGLPIGETTKVTERFHRRDFGHLEIEVTIEDPAMYSKAWTAKEEMALQPNTELMEFVCAENEKDQAHMLK